ncbi:tRNA (adenosine(37)-N6)-threonylcarbamoyltransferase complex dimerization subunit type 1 TsaB [Vibrio sp. RC27]
MSMKILAIDTSTENCSVALVNDESYFVRREVAPRDHTKKVLPMVDEVLKEAGVVLSELDALAFGRGPGSFTGVRIGIGIAQGLAFGAELPMIPVSTLAAMAQGSYRESGSDCVASAIDARMSEVYWARYERQSDGDWACVGEEVVIPPQHLVELTNDDKVWTQAGTGWNAYHDALSELQLKTISGNVLYPDAEDIAFLARFAFAKGESVTVEESSPVYLRDKVAWKKLPGRE